MLVAGYRAVQVFVQGCTFSQSGAAADLRAGL